MSTRPKWLKLGTVRSRCLGLQPVAPSKKSQFSLNAEVDKERGFVVIQTADRRQAPYRFTLVVQDAQSNLIGYTVGSTFARAELMMHKTFLAKGLGPYKDWSESVAPQYQDVAA
jgi:hypothetical protein